MKPVVIGIFGLPGSGKSTMLRALESCESMSRVRFYEGSEVISSLVPGGLDSFERLKEAEKKLQYRQCAIETIQRECMEHDCAGIVTGHFAFWSSRDGKPDVVCNDRDLSVFSHVLYMYTMGEDLIKRSAEDSERPRQPYAVNTLEEWQSFEVSSLAAACRNHDILFEEIRTTNTVTKMEQLCRDLLRHSERYNEQQMIKDLDLSMSHDPPSLQTILVLDGDKTLTATDTGKMFHTQLQHEAIHIDPMYLETLFSGPMGYTYNAFRQMVLAYHGCVDQIVYEKVCMSVASSLELYSSMQSLLQLASSRPSAKAMIVTSGHRQIWRNVLQKIGHENDVSIIGGGRLDDGYVVTAKCKATVVTRLRERYGHFVWAIGDSPLDLDMMCAANRAVVIVGHPQTRSRTMDEALYGTLRDPSFRPFQALFPPSVHHRLDLKNLPILDLSNPSVRESLTSQRLRVIDATAKPAARLLMTPTRNAAVQGPALRAAHQQVGQYLAYEFLAAVIGLEEIGIEHVQGGSTNGYRLREEDKTIVIALMRGGEPLAFGISEVFGSASFLHARDPSDITSAHLSDVSTVILVDSVINNGTTMLRFAKQVRERAAEVRIIVVAAVVQKGTIEQQGALRRAGIEYGLTVVALRFSENKFTGRGASDTGNRLFNTITLK